MINVHDLTVKFGQQKVLDGINIELGKGQVHGIIGLNGAGKTTFFNVIAKMLKPDSGRIQFAKAEITFKDTAYLETVNYFYPGITGNEYLKIFQQTNRDFNLALLQDYFKLPLNELIENYSTGMKKKLALLAILKQDKPVFILDEPFNGLDLETNKVLEIIVQILKQKNKTILISSHILEPLVSVCDKIHFLENGSFKKTFERNEFSKIDDELFSKLKADAERIILKSI